MNKDKYISVQILFDNYFLIDIMDINYNVAFNLLEVFYHANQLNKDIKNLKQLSNYNIHQIIQPNDFYINNKPNYKLFKCHQTLPDTSAH